MTTKFAANFALFSLMVLALSCSRRRPDAPYTVFMSDDFNRPDQLLTATANWTVNGTGGALITLVSQKARLVAGRRAVPDAFFASNSLFTNVTTKFDVDVVGGNVLNPLVKIIAESDTNDLGTATSHYQCGFNGSHYLTLMRSNVVLSTGSVRFDFTNGSAYQISLNRALTVLLCSATGSAADILGYTVSSQLTGGNFGFTGGVDSMNYSHVDNFEVSGN